MNTRMKPFLYLMCSLVVAVSCGCTNRDKDPEWQIRQARRSLSQADYRLAMMHVNKAVHLRPDDPSALVLRAEVQERQGLLSMAIDDYSRALSVSPGHLEALLRRGTVFRQLGRYEEAAADATEIIRVAPDLPDGYTLRAQVFRKRGRHSEAQQDLQHALTVAPMDRTVRRELGQHFEALREFGRAREAYERILSDHPRDVEAHVLLGRPLCAGEQD